MNATTRFAAPAIGALLLTSCANFGPAASPFALAIERAHGEHSLYDIQAISADLRVTFGGQTVVDGGLAFEPATGRCRIRNTVGSGADDILVFDGDTAWIRTEDEATVAMARFHLLTWPYFFAAPWKLRDAGTTLAEFEPRPLRQGTRQPSAKLTFGNEVGDSPDDWYIVYAHPTEHRLDALAYIVTYGKSVEQAEAEPHVATYDEFTVVHGLRTPSRISIYDWSAEEGLTGDPIGEVVFGAAHVVATTDTLFERPLHAVESTVPH